VLLLTKSKGAQPRSQDHKITAHLEDIVTKFCICSYSTISRLMLSCDDLKADCWQRSSCFCFLEMLWGACSNITKTTAVSPFWRNEGKDEKKKYKFQRKLKLVNKTRPILPFLPSSPAIQVLTRLDHSSSGRGRARLVSVCQPLIRGRSEEGGEENRLE